MIGAAITSCNIVDHGNTTWALSPGLTTARKTTATGMKPVGIATRAPETASNADFHPDTARIVDGRAPRDTRMSRSSRVSAADSASDMANTISAMSNTMPSTIWRASAVEIGVEPGPDQAMFAVAAPEAPRKGD